MFDYAAAQRRLQARQEARQKQRLRLWQQAQQDAQQIVQLTLNHYQPRMIVQWGSVLRLSMGKLSTGVLGDGVQECSGSRD